MATLQKVKVFLSYSHRDESLKEQLDAHLSALKRSGTIETWSDRSIGPGDEWKREINERLVAADVILLLISADFLASDFCYKIETLNALERHARGQAIVIPVVLRDVDLRGLPIASLQMLPKDAVAVTSKNWTSQDEALKNVAEGIRKSVDLFSEQRSMVSDDVAQASPRFEARYLDAAIAGEIPVDTSREVVALIRMRNSDGLASMLPVGRTHESVYSSIASEVRSEPFEAKFMIGADKTPESPVYRLTLDAPELLVQESQDKRFPLEWGRDSMRFTFFVKAERPGEQHLRVNLFRGDHHSAEVLLKSRSGGDILPGPGGLVEMLVASVKLTVNVISKAASASR